MHKILEKIGKWLKNDLTIDEKELTNTIREVIPYNLINSTDLPENLFLESTKVSKNGSNQG